MKIAEILQGIPARRRADAVWLLSSLLACSLAEVRLHTGEELPAAKARTWRAWWKRRERGEPLQLIAGFAPFYGRELAVSRAVLIPRPETERLVELALGLARPGDRVLDIGTGSGAIAITLKAESPALTVAASDISRAALRVAESNARRLGVAGIHFGRHDLLSPELAAEGWDVVVSNPPYLEFGRDYVAPDVKKWEPRLALEPSDRSRVDGLGRAGWCAERILTACAARAPRYTLLELSPRVAAALEKRWRKHAGVQRVWREADLAGRKRFLLVAWKERPKEGATG